MAVLAYFDAHGGRKSHAEIVDALGARGFDRATLYRVLMDFAEAQILTRTDLGDHVWRFELRTRTAAAHAEDHPHFVCVGCGEVSCLPGVSLRVVGRAKVPKAVGSHQVTVQLKGRCDACV